MDEETKRRGGSSQDKWNEYRHCLVCGKRIDPKSFYCEAHNYTDLARMLEETDGGVE